jgi:serine/threonine-protein kinase RsbW
MKVWILYGYIFIVCLLFFIYNLYLKKKIKEQLFFKNFLYDISKKFYVKKNKKILTNLNKDEIDVILEKIGKNEFNYKEYKINIKENGFYLEIEEKTEKETYFLEEELENKYEEEHEKLIKEKDRNYYFQKESAMKLGLILQDIYDLKMEILKKEDTINLIKIENIESKLEFFVNFMYGKMNIIFHKYRLNYSENIVKIFETQFRGKIEIKINKSLNTKEKFYLEEEKFYHFFKAVIYSILKNKEEKLEIDMKREENLLIFKINSANKKRDEKIKNDEEFFEMPDLKELGWNVELVDNSEYIVEIPLNNKIPEWAKEEKQIEILSDLKNIKTVDRNIIYDMYSKGFSEKEGSDMKLILDELLTNAIEHGNKYDISKKVMIKYRFNEKEEGIQIEISDEGDGFPIDIIRLPDSSSERGRGIFIVRKIADEIDYIDNGKTVLVYKKRSTKNDSE